MDFVSSPVSVQVPATSANLGPGFDSLGLALSLHDQVTARVTTAGVQVRVSGEGAGELPTDARHLIVETMYTTFDRLGDRPSGLLLECDNHIPQARGLGSSSAAIVAGILLARHLIEDGPKRLDEAAIIQLAAAIEGHPDNVAACVLGGLTVAWSDPDRPDGGARAVRLAETTRVTAVIFVPKHRGYTAQARKVLPTLVPLADAAFNAARTALLTRALTQAPELLLDGTEDRLHQGYRAGTMPDTTKLVAALRGDAIAAVVSGAGPSVLALVPDDPRLVAEAVDHRPDGWWVRPVTIASDGAQVLSGLP